MVKFYDSGNGYLRNGKYGTKHRILWAMAFGNIPKGYVVHHKNGNKNDNRLVNLECLPDIVHRRMHARYHEKLPEEKQRRIKEMHQKGESIAKISKELKIANATAWDYVHGNKRKHIRKRFLLQIEFEF
jgi:hypothetical protein